MKNQKSKVRVQPLGDRVLVRPHTEAEKEKTKSGIYIPVSGDKKEAPSEGEVIAVGEGRYENGTLIPMNVKIGDTVMFSRYSYDDVKIDGEEYYILKQENILAIITK
jgi:chaperonin GroES